MTGFRGKSNWFSTCFVENQTAALREERTLLAVAQRTLRSETRDRCVKRGENAALTDRSFQSLRERCAQRRETID